MGAPDEVSAVDAGLLFAEGKVHEDARLVISDGRVERIEPSTVLDAPAIGNERSIVLPGLVNLHQHGRPIGTASLGIPDAPLERWLLEISAILGPVPEVQARSTAVKLLSRGTTATAHFAYTSATSQAEYEREILDLIDAYRKAGLRILVLADLRDRGEPVYGDTDAFLGGLPDGLRTRLMSGDASTDLLPVEARLEVIASLHADLSQRPSRFAAVGLGPPGPPWCSEQSLRRIAEAGMELSIPVQMHLHETRAERAQGFAEYGQSAVSRMAELGLLDERTSLAHCVWMSDEDLEAVRGSSSTVVTNPSSNLRLHAGVAPLPAMMEMGIPVAIATDNNSLDDQDDLRAEATLCRAIHRAVSVTADGIPADDLVRMITEVPGRAAGFGESNLAPGEPADLVILSPVAGQDAQRPTLDQVFSPRFEVTGVVVGGVPLPHEAGSQPMDPFELDGSTRELVQELRPYLERHYADLVFRAQSMAEFGSA